MQKEVSWVELMVLLEFVVFGLINNPNLCYLQEVEAILPGL